MGLSGGPQVKRNLCSCQLSAKFLTCPSFSPSRVPVYMGDWGVGDLKNPMNLVR